MPFESVTSFSWTLMIVDIKSVIDQNNVLVVEDEPILRLVYCNFLERLGFQIKGRVADGKKAIEIVRKCDFDLVVMDISLQGEMDGIEAMHEIRKLSRIPVLFITGKPISSLRERVKTTDYLEILEKPIQFKEFRSSILNLYNRMRK